ncbi:bacteriophage T4 gp5 trimerisation domain-containing protein, partial [Escherichia coli]
RSLRFGKPQHASQLTFDDNRNNERVMLHAERDLQTTVERNQATEVGMDKFDIIRRTFTDWFTNHVSYKDYVFSITGFDASIKGVSASMTGVSLTATGVSTSFTGVSTSFTGVSTSFTGVSTSFTGLSTSFTGQ